MDKEQRQNSDLEKILARIKPSDFLDYRVFLQNLYQAMKRTSQGINYREFANLLGFGHSTLIHQIVKGYRPLTLKTAKKIISALNLPDLQKKYLEGLVRFGNAKNASDKENSLKHLMELKSLASPSVLDRDILNYFSKWYHPVIRELILLDDFQNDPDWIGKTLRPSIKSSEAAESLELLERIGYITFDREQSKFVQAQPRLSTGHDVEGLGLLNFHLAMLDRAKESLNHSTQDERDFGAITLNVSEETLKEMKQRMRRFQIELLDLAETQDSSDQIYQMNLQLFPLSRKPGSGD